MSDGAWIFLSHSHKDFDQVVPLRNSLEEQGHHPLLFFLKCLDDDAEIDSLIEREIRARSWFVLCDSENARASRWVKEEIGIIRKLPEKTSITVNLDDDLDNQLKAIRDLTLRATVFLSYSRQDRPIAEKVTASLRADDFGVFFDLDSLSAGSDWQSNIEVALREAIERGAVVALLSRETLRSAWVEAELHTAFKLAGENRASIVPVFLQSPEIVLEDSSDELRRKLEAVQWVDLSADFGAGMRLLKQGLRALDYQFG